MQKLAEEMICYIRFLEKEYGLEISLCDLHESIFPYSNLLTPYNTHRNHSCVLLKKYAAVQRECIYWQKAKEKRFPRSLDNKNQRRLQTKRYFLFKIYRWS